MKAAVWLSILTIAAMAGVSIYGFINIPEGTMIARHWNLNGEPDGFSPRNHVLIGMPAIGVLLSIMFAAIPKIDPRKENIARSMNVLIVGWLGALMLIAVTHASIVLAAAQGQTAQFFGFGGTLYGVCLFFIVIGNFIAKSRSNFFIGVRTPWTLSSEHAWNVANRTAGWLLVLTGVASAATGVFASPADGFRVLIAGAVTMAVVSVIVSYFAWKNDPDRKEARS
ncbi:MAG: SdpI family protein [Pseudomonadota bacterium]